MRWYDVGGRAGVRAGAGLIGQCLSRAGFTLLEVLIAFAVMALTLIAAYQLLGTGLRGSARAERVTLALLAAESKLAEIGVSAPLRAGRSGGALGGGYRWRAEVRRRREPAAEASSAAASPVAAYEVSVTVSWGGRAAESVRLETLRLAATPRGRDE